MGTDRFSSFIFTRFRRVKNPRIRVCRERARTLSSFTYELTRLSASRSSRRLDDSEIAARYLFEAR